MKPLSFAILSTSLIAILFTSGCTKKNANCPPPQMMPPMPPPPCCCNNNDPGGMRTLPPQPGDNAHFPQERASHWSHPEMSAAEGNMHSPFGGMGGIPVSKEAVEACTGKNESETCTFNARGWTLSGTCSTGPRRPQGEPAADESHRGTAVKGKNPDSPLVCSPVPRGNTDSNHKPRTDL